MEKYEIMYILKANLDEAARAAANEKIANLLTKNGAEILETKDWGLREFAYPINDEAKGYYVILKVNAEETALYEFRRKSRHNSDMLRNLVTVARD